MMCILGISVNIGNLFWSLELNMTTKVIKSRYFRLDPL